MLEGSESRVVIALSGPVLGIVCAVLVVSSTRGPDELRLQIVTGAIVLSLVWVLVEVAIKGVEILRARRFVALARSMRSCRPEEASRRAAMLAQASWPPVRALGVYVGDVLAGRDPDDPHARFRHECEIDAARAAARRGTTRMLIRAMPILGLIGMIVGFELAVPDLVLPRAGVPSGLSPAFDAMLLALTATLVAMAAASFVRRREESLRNDVEQAGLDLSDPYASTGPTSLRSAAGRGPEARRRPEPRELRIARSPEAASRRGTEESVDSPSEKLTRDPFWRAPWTSGGAEVRARVTESEPEHADVAEELEAPHEERIQVATSPRNRLAVMWGFGLLFLGTGTAVVAGWLVDRVLIPPDFALVALIIGATFWSMAALSGEQ